MTTIRRATIKDIKKITPMWINLMEFHSETHALFHTAADFREKAPNDIKMFLEKPTTAFFVAENDNNLIGFSMTSISSRPDVFANTKKGYIGETFVNEKFRSQGIGAKLISAVKEWLTDQQVDFIDLQVTSTNEQGKKFWENQGFRTVNYHMVNDLRN